MTERSAEVAQQAVPGVGDPAPEVELSDDRGTVHRLADQRGRWVVLYFYPEDDTPGCTTEACQFRDAHEEIADRGAEVWGISPDGAASHAAFRSKFNLPFTLLSDEEHAVSTRYGAWRLKNSYGREHMGIQRSSFLVDPAGRIAHVWPRVKADGHAADVLATIEAARSAYSA